VQEVAEDVKEEVEDELEKLVEFKDASSLALAVDLAKIMPGRNINHIKMTDEQRFNSKQNTEVAVEFRNCITVWICQVTLLGGVLYELTKNGIDLS